MNLIGKYGRVMVDEPEVFISPDSPYKGAKPQDLAAVSGLIRNSLTTALLERGYNVVDKPAPDALYTRLAVTDLRIAQKKKSVLTYTPAGFVVSQAVKGMQEFMDKYDVLGVSLQVEVQDSAKHNVLGATVFKRGQGVDDTEPKQFDIVVAVTKEFGERFACRLDNAHFEPARRIDCLDQAARKARPKVVGQ